MRVVVALGGNALDGKARQGVYAAQVRNALAASRQILEIVKAGHQVVLTHGNGPQV
ncbi:MAG: carbamate kinase, partial [Nitrososphaerota archaeon]|nr:carbamate kinase [Nitrososphaerota archaeon]